MRVGRVALVGAGPGDPGLLTVRGLELIRAADVIVYDRLVNPELLDEARPDALRISAAKRPGAHRLSQPQINELLVIHARQGREVVRLKGGDPFVFGRGGEEAEALVAAGVPFEVVPGVSSAIAAPAYAGIPVTDRRYASSFAVVTATEEPERSDARVRWERLATSVDTLVVLMGVARLSSIVATLERAGRPAATPVAIVVRATTAAQRTVVGTLGTIVEAAEAAAVESPAVIVVGEVVRLSEKLSWFAGDGLADFADADLEARST
ncbi:MAG: uroporphyrinogen-III C-methyltransferase [Candidatus Rokubacteria bacterium]|nr:uroporphyrinogen-III C-methyltransferase [Candidatus Rokubacteria bacterium]